MGNQNNLLIKYRAIGARDFYRFLLTTGISKLVKIKNNDYDGISPEIEFLNYSDQLLFLYRRHNNEDLIEMSRIYRKAAHKLYRLQVKKNFIPKNYKFLNLVG